MTETNGVDLALQRRAFHSGDKSKQELPWTLRAYAARCVLSNWQGASEADHEWAATLALCIDKFARDWVASNCSGRAHKRPK